MQATTQHSQSDRTRRYFVPLGLCALTLVALNLLLPRWFAPADGMGQTVGTSGDVDFSAELPIALAEQVVVPEDGVLLTTDDGDLANWQPIQGVWNARDRGIQHGSSQGFDNFIVYTAPFQPPYALEATIQHIDGVGTGLFFEMLDPTTTANSTLLRFETDGSAIYWGKFDEAGEFDGEGFAPISIDPYAPHRLSILNHGNRYDVMLDGEMVVTDLPLRRGSGHVALAASESEALFYDVTVVPIDGVGNLAPTMLDLTDNVVGEQTLLEQVETISGEWVYENGEIRQVLQDATDFLTGLNILGRAYTLNATITLGEQVGDAGGGFIFHMPDRANKAGGTMVRIIDGGAGVAWGQFDAEGVFQGAGNIGIEVPQGESIQLSVAVSDSAYDIVVNGETIVNAISLPNEEGWLGLVAYRGVVTFRDVTLDLDG